MLDRQKSAAQSGLQATPIAVPDWDASRAADSFRAFAAQVHGMAKEVLLRDGHHAEMFFFVLLGGQGHIVLWRNDDRDLEAQWLRRHIKEQYAYGVVHVVEAWMRIAAKPGDHVLRQVMSGEIRVSELRPDDRKECLLVTTQSRDGYAQSWVDEMVRDGGKLSLGACTEIGDFRGRFGKVFG